jgi:secreted trypsin-like serine protease
MVKGISRLISSISKTAAHCFQKPNIESVTAKIGIYDLEDDPTRQIVTVQSWVLHPYYDPAKASNDIAIVRLGTTVNVKPVSITFENGFPKVGTTTKVFGFGKESPAEDEISDELLEISLTVSRPSYCREKLGTPYVFSATQICAGGSGKVGKY